MTLAALILAGGLSQRMGVDKALLAIAGTPLVRRTWDIARSLTPAVWIVTPHPDRYRLVFPSTAQWIVEPPPTPGMTPAGPLVAFTQAMAQIEADWVLLLSCDLPTLQADVLRQWAQTLPLVNAAAIAYLPHHPKGWDPLCGFYRHTCLPSLQAYVAQGRRSFQGWLASQTVQPIPNVPAEMLVNLNTLEDWLAYRDRPTP